MPQEPYAAPKADLETKSTFEVPESIRKKIKSAWVAGVVSIVITVLFTVIAMSGTDLIGLDASAFIDAFLMLIFVIGIYKNSRTCAVLMWLLFAANKVIMWMEAGSLSGVPVALIFLWFYTQGVIGTFEYHRYIKKHRQEPNA